MAGPVGQAVGAAFAAVGAGIMGVVGAQASFAKSSIEAASRYGQYEAVFVGVTGSLKEGEKVMRGLQNYAQKSGFTLDALSQSAARLATSGMSIKELLPVMARLAISTGDLSPEKLNMFAGALIKIKGGALGEAKEILQSAGIGNDQLRSAGVNISKSGEVKSSPYEFMEAVKSLASSPQLLAIEAEMMKTMAVKISNFGDAIDKAQVAFGKALSGDAGNALTSFSDSLNELTDAGVIGEVATSFKDLVVTLSGTANIGDGLAQMAAGLMAFNTTLGSFIKGLAEGPVKYLLGPVALGIKNVFDANLKAEREGIEASLQIARAKRKKAEDEGLAETGQRLKKDAKKQEDTKTTPPLATPAAAATQNPFLRKIEENTRQSKDALQAMAFGNGRGMNGITPVELSAMKSGRRSRNASTDLFALLEEFVFDAVQRGRAAGVG
jgi:hypothetical protein